MEVADVSPALHERLGQEATVGLLDLFNTARQEWTTDVTIAAVERFDRRLLDETSSLRTALAKTEAALREVDAGLRQEIRDVRAGLRQEIRDVDSGLRQQIRDVDATLRQEMRDGISLVRQDLVAGRFELVKWSFAFWVGQVVAIASVVGVMFRFMR